MSPKFLKPTLEHRQGRIFPTHRWTATPPPPGSPPSQGPPTGGGEHYPPYADPRYQKLVAAVGAGLALLYTLHPEKIRARIQASRTKVEEAIQKWEKRGKVPDRLIRIRGILDKAEEAVDAFEAYWRLVFPAGLMPRRRAKR